MVGVVTHCGETSSGRGRRIVSVFLYARSHIPSLILRVLEVLARLVFEVLEALARGVGRALCTS